MDTYMKLTASWGPWSAFRRYTRDELPHFYHMRYRKLYVGRIELCTLCETTLNLSAPFYFYFPTTQQRRSPFATRDDALAAIRLILEAPL